jgi:predicted amidohydrolase YtcJ
MKKADLIVHHAKVYTVDKDFSVAECFAIKDGKFIAVGTNDEILSYYSASQVIDAMGKPVYPGFIDAHCHFYSYGLNLLRYADLSGSRSFAEVVEKIKEFSKTNHYDWIVGRGWDQNDWVNKEFPDNKLLNQIFPDIPVLLIRVDGHAALANNEALRIAGINPGTHIDGGEILIKNGILTGILIDNAADLLKAKIPKPALQTKIMALFTAQKKCFSVGLTSVADAGLSKDAIELIDSLQRKAELKMRVYAMLDASPQNIEAYLKKGTYKTDYLDVRSIKLYADGALGSRGAKLILSYSDSPGYNGLLMEKHDFYKNICSLALKYGYQVNTHAIGDSANRFILNIYGSFLRGNNDLRWRIEHAQVIDPSDFELFKKYCIIPSVQSTHATSDMFWASDRLGNYRIKYAYALRLLMDQNGWIANGTDFPVENISPLLSIYAAVARKDLKGFPENGFQKENALSRQEAVRSVTIWAARAAFEENEKGSIETGKFADFVITDLDIIQVNENIIPEIKVLSTFSSGKIVYSRDD